MPTHLGSNILIGLLTILVFTAGIVTAGHAQGSKPKYGILGQKAPELASLKWIDADGKDKAPTYISDYRGKVIYMLFFQDW